MLYVAVLFLVIPYLILDAGLFFDDSRRCSSTSIGTRISSLSRSNESAP